MQDSFEPTAQEPRKNPLARLPTRKVAWNALKAVISIGLLIFLGLKMNWPEVLHALSQVPLLSLIGGLALFFVSQFLAAARLQYLFKAQGFSLDYLYVLRLTFISLFTGNFLPSTIGGDAFKLILLAQAGYGKARSGMTLVVDRVVNLAAAAVLLPAVLSLPGTRDGTSGQATLWLLILVGVGGLGTLAMLFFLYHRRMPRVGEDASSSLVGRVTGVLERLLEVAAEWRSRPGALVVALVLSMGAVLAGIASLGIQILALGIPVNPVQLTGVFVLVYWVTLLPISLNGLGIQEVGLAYLLGRLGLDQSLAAVLALLPRVYYLITSIPGGIWLTLTPLTQKST